MHGLLTHTNIRIQSTTTIWDPPYPPHYDTFGRTMTSDMTSEGFGEMFEGDSADTYAGNYLSCHFLEERTTLAELTGRTN